ncbi:MAG: lipopolysaccharide biosynthesis protein [Coriobacteriia bacterium]|nr:lipopolysaccharide biosynthesis protein [Coriobacteriia bacterium]
MSLLTASRKRLAGEAGWVFAGQLASAVGTLVGLRLVTEVVPPSIYGSVVLAIGIVVLAQGLAVTPMMQAALRFHPECTGTSGESELRRTVVAALRRPVVWGFALLVVVLGAWYQSIGGTAFLGLACGALFVVEVARTFQVVFLNAARRQRPMALLVAADAWLRPVLAVVAVLVFGVSALAVVGGYIAGTTLTLAGFAVLSRSEHHVRVLPRPANQQEGVAGAGELWMYAKPLILLPLVGWVSGQADRYIIGGLAGLELAGIYAAVYGLASRPFLMLSNGVELTLRQVYYARVSVGDRSGQRRVFAVWLAAVLGASLALLVTIALLHQQIASVLLASEYRVYSSLMIWIGAGYVFVGCTQVVERICYARNDTRGVTLAQIGGAALSLFIVPPMVLAYGIQGAAWAVPVYFGGQFLLTAARARYVLYGKARKLSDSTYDRS